MHLTLFHYRCSTTYASNSPITVVLVSFMNFQEILFSSHKLKNLALKLQFLSAALKRWRK